MNRKKLEELTILDNFMFSAVMITDPENCREVLECALGMAIDRVEVVSEKTMVYHSELNGGKDMLFEEMLKDEFNAGKLEAIKILLSVKGMVSQSLEDKLARVSDEEKLLFV